MLKIVHIDRALMSEQIAAQKLWDEVLKPKWELLARERADLLREELLREQREKGRF